MKHITHKEYGRVLEQSFEDTFQLEEDGLYFFEITASAKSWWQNTVGRRSFLKKDSLTLQINSKKISESSKKKKLHADDFWNGNILKGNDQTIGVIAHFQKGSISIAFDVHEKPFLEEVDIYFIADGKVLLQKRSPSKRDRIPWLTFLIAKDIFLSSLSIDAKAGVMGGDDDDLQIFIDGKVQKNQNNSTHRDWYWCGYALRGASLMYERKFDIENKPSSIYITADGQPVVHEISLELKNIGHQRTPSVDDPRWTGDFRDDPDKMIFARTIFGEGRSLPELGRVAIGWVIRNRIGYQQWGNTYHDVILHARHFSAFNKNDHNRVIVENPSSDQNQNTAWKECYEIAVGIIQGSIADPTKGANHYYSTSIKPPFWTRSKGAELTLSVENTLFYRIPQTGKRIVIPVLFVALLFGTIGFFALASIRVEPFSLTHEKSTHFSERIADNSIAVYYGCGTECEGIRVFDEKTGKQKAEFNYGVGYLWSPDKKYVAAFHSSAGHGITVGDMMGNELLVYTKPLENYFDIPSVASWSPDSSKIAVLLQDDEAHYDLFVFWGFNSISRITSVPVPQAEKYTIEWARSGKAVVVNGGTARLEIDESGYGHHYSQE